MKYPTKIYYTEADKSLVWDRWQKGESLNSIARHFGLLQAATAFGLIWAGLVIASGMIFNIGAGTVIDLYGKDPAEAATIWLAISVVHEALGGGNEIVGGLWILLLSWAALRLAREKTR